MFSILIYASYESSLGLWAIARKFVPSVFWLVGGPLFGNGSNWGNPLPLWDGGPESRKPSTDNGVSGPRTASRENAGQGAGWEGLHYVK